MYKVYFNDNTIVFPRTGDVFSGAVISDPDESCMRGIISDCLDKGSVKIAFISSTGQDLQKIFDGFFRHIDAAGGIVRNTSSGKILMIRRSGRWDLPKGWMESGETRQQNALREVAEETGIDRLTEEGFITCTHHAYRLDGHWALKHTYWYAMSSPQEQTVPQTEEGIDRACWFDLQEIHRAMEHTYANIRETMEIFLQKYPMP